MMRMRPVKRACLCALLAALFSSAMHGAESAPLVSLQTAADTIDAVYFWDPLSGMIVVSKNGHQVNFRPDDPLVLFDYSRFDLMDPPVRSSRGVFLTSSFVSELESFFAQPAPSVQYRVGAILIDPGHGGKDPGAVGKARVGGKTVEVKEKDVVLAVAKDLHARLRSQYPDKKILLTRDGDTYPTLEDRVEMANSIQLGAHEAILYVSIHVNAAFNTKSSGFEVWYLSPDYRRTVIDKAGNDEAAAILPILNSMMEEEFTTESILIAKSLLDSLDAQIGTQSKNRGIKEEAWFVVRNAKMPSVLVELGFVSNPEEAALLADPAYLRKCALGIYNGLSSFITHFENSRGFTTLQ